MYYVWSFDRFFHWAIFFFCLGVPEPQKVKCLRQVLLKGQMHQTVSEGAGKNAGRTCPRVKSLPASTQLWLLGKTHVLGGRDHCSFLSKFSLPPEFFKDYLFIFRQKGKEEEREGEKHQCVVASRASPTGYLAHNPGMYPDWESNQCPLFPRLVLSPLSHTSQGSLLNFFPPHVDVGSACSASSPLLPVWMDVVSLIL